MLKRLLAPWARSPEALTFRLIVGAGRPYWAGFLVLVLGGAALPILLMIAISALVGALTRAVTNGVQPADPVAFPGLTALVAVVAVLFVAFQVRWPLIAAFAEAAGRRVEQRLQGVAMTAMLGAPGMDRLEDPALQDAVAAARDLDAAVNPPSLAARDLVFFATGQLSAIASGIVLASFALWAPLVLATALYVHRRWSLGRVRSYRAVADRSPEALRRSAYERDLAIEAPTAKEVRVFGLGGWLGARSNRHWQAAMARLWRERAIDPPMTVVTLVGILVACALILGALAVAGVTGELSAAGVALYLQAFLGMDALFWPDRQLAIATAARPFPTVLALPGLITRGGLRAMGTRDAATLPRSLIRLEHVGFRYPGSDHRVFDDLNLDIHAGQSLAIVGANGAGKTTLVKVLARLYDPADGRITVDGLDLRELDLAAWRRRIAVIFQDFVRYPFSARDNVGLADLAQASQASGSADIAIALRQASVEAIVAGLPDGLDTPLSREFGGVDLSGGEWQRIALARALFAVRVGASVLVLDEPTANLDVRAEADLFDRFLELTAGLTTILISHRFSTVRHAQRIVVLEAGRVIEDGPHAELLALGGRYAYLFSLQAAPFSSSEPSDNC